MNRTELVDSVARATGLDKKQADSAVGAVVDSVIAATKAGDKVSIFGFGTFTPKARAARIGRNPQTGAPVKIAASTAVGFSVAAAYKATLNPRSAAKKSAANKTAAAKKSSPAKKSSAAKAAPAKAAPTKKAPAAKKASAAKKSAPAVATKAPAGKKTSKAGKKASSTASKSSKKR